MAYQEEDLIQPQVYQAQYQANCGRKQDDDDNHVASLNGGRPRHFMAQLEVGIQDEGD